MWPWLSKTKTNVNITIIAVIIIIIIIIILLLYLTWVKLNIMWKGSVFRLSLVSIFPHLNWIQRDTEYLSVFSANAKKCGPE